jgi:hypothetical protein
LARALEPLAGPRADRRLVSKPIFDLFAAGPNELAVPIFSEIEPGRFELD